MPIFGMNREGSISIRELRWGLVPHRPKDAKIGCEAINARAERVDEKPMFREAFTLDAVRNGTGRVKL